MIIIKTANGDRFVNEAETLMVTHNKDAAIVTVHPKSWSNEFPSSIQIQNVESVTYATADQLGKYEDKGSQVEKLQKELSKQLEWGSNIREKYMEMELECDQLKEEVEKLRNHTKTMEASNAESAPKKKISLRATSPVGSDCTQAFDVENCDGMTVIDFIKNVINYDPYVTIDFMRDGKHIWKGKFNNQEIQTEQSQAIPGGMYGMTVKSAKASGGYGQMSYHVELYELGKPTT